MLKVYRNFNFYDSIAEFEGQDLKQQLLKLLDTLTIEINRPIEIETTSLTIVDDETTKSMLELIQVKGLWIIKLIDLEFCRSILSLVKHDNSGLIYLQYHTEN